MLLLLSNGGFTLLAFTATIATRFVSLLPPVTTSLRQ